MKQMHRQWCRLVFSKLLGRMIAFGDIVSPGGRGPSGGFLRLSLRACSLTSCLIGALAATPALTTPAWANPNLPSGEQIVSGVSGGGIVISPDGRNMVITQADVRSIINWDTFNIGSGYSVEFKQSGASHVVLNRVIGGEESIIEGILKANGQVFLLNPNGIVFTHGAQVNVSGLLASTLSMDDKDFKQALYRLTSDPKAAGKAVINNGTLETHQGGTVPHFIALVGDQVKNTGTITAPRGRVVLAAGETVTLKMGISSLLSVTVDKEVARTVLLENSGTIKAPENGMIQLTARGANALTSLAINNTGTLEAKGLRAGPGGQIVLEGGSGAVVLHGRDQNTRSNISAGNVTINGKSVEIKDVNLTATQGDITINAESTAKNIPVWVEKSNLRATNDLKITAVSKTDPGTEWWHTELLDKGALTVIGSHLGAGRFMELTGKTENGAKVYGIGGITLEDVTLKASKGKFTGETNSGYQSAYTKSSAGIALFGQMSFEGLFDLDARTSGGAAAFYMTDTTISLINGAKVNVRATGDASDSRKNLGTVTFQKTNSVEGDGEFIIDATANTNEATVYFYGGALKGNGKTKVSLTARNTGSGDGILIHQGENPRFTGISNVNLSGGAGTGDGVRFVGNRPITVENSTISGTSQDGTGVSFSGAEDVSLKGRTVVIGTGQVGKEIALSPGVSSGEDVIFIRRTGWSPIRPGG